MAVRPAPLDAPYLEGFCQQIIDGAAPLGVVCQPMGNQVYNECFVTVGQQVAQAGGSLQLGWAIWAHPGAYVEAEFHAVWRTPAGELIDIVHRPIPVGCITFLPDSQRRYQGRQIDNIRLALVGDNDVKRFLFLSRRRFEILNSGDLADQHGEIALPKHLAREYLKAEKELILLVKRLARRYPG